eukprot:360693-Chlamydomonas_euryale.AAC.1
MTPRTYVRAWCTGLPAARRLHAATRPPRPPTPPAQHPLRTWLRHMQGVPPPKSGLRTPNKHPLGTQTHICTNPNLYFAEKRRTQLPSCQLPPPPLCIVAGLARKVNEFLSPASLEGGVTSWPYAKQMDKWLERLDQQLSFAVPMLPKDGQPDAEIVIAWAKEFCDTAVQLVDSCMQRFGILTSNVAKSVQDAIIVSCVTGAHIPPCRLNFITSMIHPHMASTFGNPCPGCQDKDCRLDDCKGNHLELSSMQQVAGSSDQQIEVEGHFGCNNTILTTHVVHGKTEFSNGGGVVMKYTIPCGPLTKLLLAHIMEGHTLLTQAGGTIVPNLIVTSRGEAYPCPSVFTQTWARIMKGCPIAARLGLQYFAPSAARTIFVEGYTSTHGVGPELWEGAALIMGNSVQQWFQSYNPSKKRRLAQQTVDNHSAYITNMGASNVHINMQSD